MSLAAGRLRHSIRIERQVQTKNSFGETKLNWEPLREKLYPCEIKPLSARELQASEQIQSEVSTVIVMRYNIAIRASMRAVHVVNGVDGTIYNLTDPIRDPDSGLEWMSIPATSGLNEG